MKRCPECGRDYNDDSLSFCLDDGSELLFGPAMGEPETAIIGATPSSEAPTRQQIEHTDPDPRTASQSETTRRMTTPLLAVAAVAIILMGGLAAYRYFLYADANHIESIAVMPFANASGNPEVEFLCDGMTEALINTLSRLPNLSVKARNSVFRYKGRDISSPDIGRELSVQAVLLGRITKQNDQLQLKLELVDAKTETVIWNDEYDRSQSDLIALQSEIVRDVSANLRNKLSRSDIQRIERSLTTNSEAYQHYLRGRFEWNKRQKEPLLRAVEHFKKAIELDPSFALAHAGLADCYIVFSSYEVAPPSEAYPLARASAQKALELDPGLAQAYTNLAAINEDFDWDFVAAEKNYRRSIELDPNNPSTHQWLGEFLRVLNRFDESLTEGKRSLDLDPVSLSTNNSYGLTFFYANRCDEAIAQQTKTIELDPTYPWPYARIADCYTVKGMYDEALANYRKAIALSNQGAGANWILANYGHALGVSGNAAEARKIADELRNRQKTEMVEGDNFALLYYGIGDLDTAFAELERAYRERSPGVRYIKVDPRYDMHFRSDSRYQALIKKIGLSQ